MHKMRMLTYSYLVANSLPRLATCSHSFCLRIKSATVIGSGITRSFSTQDDYQYLQKSTTPTMHFQRSLPRLPVPELQKTSERYLKSLEPLVSQDQLWQTKKVLQKFTSEEGKMLHEELKSIDQKNKGTSYISAPWFDMYLKARDSILLNYNPLMAFVDDPKPKYNDQLIRSTNMLISALRFMKSLRKQILAPEVFHLNPAKSDNDTFRMVTRLLPSAVSWYGAYMFNAYPLDMSQYNNLFNSTRIPELGKDRIFKDESARHILVMKKGNFYIFDALDENGNILPPEHIHRCMQYIVEKQQNIPEHPLGYLTTEDRDTWAKARQQLIQAGNQETLRLVDSALFTLILDEDETKETEPVKLTHNLLCGNGHNRWLDKSFQLIVTKNGKAALNFEHSWGDGVAVLRFFNEIYADSTEKPRVHPNAPPANLDPSGLVRQLEFKLDAASKKFIEDAKEKYLKVISSIGIHVLEYDKFGKEFLKKKKISPDAVMQLSFQMGFYKQTGRTVATYESCSTSAFKHGRTETIRPATTATKECSKAFFMSPRPDYSSLRTMMEACSKVHNQLTKEAAMGQGFDRHLFAMRVLAEAKGMKPAIFTDPSYPLINHNILSTSTLSSANALIGGFGPVVRDGFGVAYVIRDGMAGCIVTCYPPHRDGAGYIDCLRASLNDIYEVLDNTGK